jgi:DNA-binding NarL/FixJ family response regulator
LSVEARVVGQHHERCDGSGYPSGLVPAATERLARRLAAADAYRAMLEDRPHRVALGPDAAAKELRESASRGALCPRAVAEVLSVAGHAQARSEPPSHGLTAREVEVLVKLARGLTNKEVSVALRIAPRTVQHHVENIYAKIGVSTRAAAALFAVRNELVVPTLEA